jgi:hypothetical protein
MPSAGCLAAPLANRVYRRLFLSQVSALLGTGVMTVALALLAYELAGEAAGAVLGIAFTLRIVAFVLISPVVGAYAHLLPRRQLLVGLDLARAATVLVLPFVDAVCRSTCSFSSSMPARQASRRSSRRPFPMSCRMRRSTRGRFRSPALPTIWSSC